MGRKYGLFAHSLWSLDTPFAELEAESGKVSGVLREYSRFGEIVGRDRFDHDCRPTMVLCRGKILRPDRAQLGFGHVSRSAPSKPLTFVPDPVFKMQTQCEVARRHKQHLK